MFYQIKGTAKNGKDFATLNGSTIIPAGQSKIKLKVKAIADRKKEGGETVILKLLPSSTGAYVIGKPKKAVITIIDSQ